MPLDRSGELSAGVVAIGGDARRDSRAGCDGGPFDCASAWLSASAPLLVATAMKCCAGRTTGRFAPVSEASHSNGGAASGANRSPCDGSSFLPMIAGDDAEWIIAANQPGLSQRPCGRQCGRQDFAANEVSLLLIQY